jgi:hypothetical protein
MDPRPQTHPPNPKREADHESDQLRGAGERVLIAACDVDVAAAERLRAGLASRGFAPRTLRSPADGRELARRIRGSDFIVVLLSTAGVPEPSAPEPDLARILKAVGSLRGHALYLIPARLDAVEPGPLDADHLQIIDLHPYWDRGENEIAHLMVANYGRWDLESRHFMILAFATLFIVSALILALVALPGIVDEERSLGSILVAGGASTVWLYGTFLASAWIGDRLGRWARFRRLEREWAWGGFLAVWATALALLLL